MSEQTPENAQRAIDENGFPRRLRKKAPGFFESMRHNLCAYCWEPQGGPTCCGWVYHSDRTEAGR